LFIEAKLPSSLQKALGLSRQGKGKNENEKAGKEYFILMRIELREENYLSLSLASWTLPLKRGLKE
jgi:hypothetical protein